MKKIKWLIAAALLGFCVTFSCLPEDSDGGYTVTIKCPSGKKLSGWCRTKDEIPALERSLYDQCWVFEGEGNKQ